MLVAYTSQLFKILTINKSKKKSGDMPTQLLSTCSVRVEPLEVIYTVSASNVNVLVTCILHYYTIVTVQIERVSNTPRVLATIVNHFEEKIQQEVGNSIF